MAQNGANRINQEIILVAQPVQIVSAPLPVTVIVKVNPVEGYQHGQMVVDAQPVDYTSLAPPLMQAHHMNQDYSSQPFHVSAPMMTSTHLRDPAPWNISSQYSLSKAPSHSLNASTPHFAPVNPALPPTPLIGLFQGSTGFRPWISNPSTPSNPSTAHFPSHRDPLSMRATEKVKSSPGPTTLYPGSSSLNMQSDPVPWTINSPSSLSKAPSHSLEASIPHLASVTPVPPPTTLITPGSINLHPGSSPFNTQCDPVPWTTSSQYSLSKAPPSPSLNASRSDPATKKASNKPYTPRYVRPGTKCQVCGKKASGRHYKRLTCEGCKGFFRRTIQENKKYKECTNASNCDINAETRKCYKECRIKKCLDIGMDKESVLKEERRARRKKNTVVDEERAQALAYDRETPLSRHGSD